MSPLDHGGVAYCNRTNAGAPPSGRRAGCYPHAQYVTYWMYATSFEGTV